MPATTNCPSQPLIARAGASDVVSLTAADSDVLIRSVTHAPQAPPSGQGVIISARLAPGLSDLRVHYPLVDPGRYIARNDPAFTTQWTSLPTSIEGISGASTWRSIEYRNRLREIRDLLFNDDEAGRLIEECAALVADPAGGPSPVDADRAKWDFHPVMAMGGKAGPGLFYQATPTRDFRGMVQLMRNFVTEITVPSNALTPGRTCRARVRVKDVQGRYSHWSAPVEIQAGQRDR